MKARIFVAACGILISANAQAQMAVDSFTADFNAVKSLYQEGQAYALQGEQAITEAHQLEQLVSTYQAFVQNPSLGAALGLMNQAGLGNDLPINPAGLMSLTSGYSMSLANLGAKLSALSSLSNTAYAQNHVYDCTDTSFACTQQKQRAYAIAGSAGIAQSAYQDLRNHLPVIQALRDQAAQATDPAKREQVELALQSETVWNNNLAAQIQAAEMQARSDESSLAQQDNEKTTQAVEATIAAIPK